MGNGDSIIDDPPPVKISEIYDEYKNCKVYDEKPKDKEDKKEDKKNKEIDYIKELKELPELIEIKDYEVNTRQLLGEGRMAIIVKGKNKTTNKEIAVKILNNKYYDDNKFIYPPQELTILDGIQHPNIVSIFEGIAEESLSYLFCEIIYGEELFDYLKRVNRVSENEAKYYTQQLVAALDFLHRNGICHRDLKAENILMINPDEKENGKGKLLKLIDFDLAAKFNEKSMLIDHCGSQDYAAPEIWERIPYIGSEVDIWSLGVIIYLMITSYLPFTNRKSVINFKWDWPPLSISPKPSTNLDRLIRMIFVPRKLRSNMETIMASQWLNEELENKT
jgi:serine/threonine protein kinase